MVINWKLKCKYSNILRYWFWLSWAVALIIKIKTKKLLKCFTLHAMNLKYMKVSLFEITYKKKWTFSRHSNSLRCTCMLLWSFWKAWAKSVVKVFLYNCLTRLCPQTAGIHLRTQWQHLLCFVCSLWGASNFYHTWKLLYSVASPSFYQEVMILFSLTCWMETMLYSQMFYAIFQFCAQV